MSESNQRWWGSATVPMGQTRRWTIGPSTLWVERAANEWRVVIESSRDPHEDDLEIAQADSLEGGLLAHDEVQRFGTSSESTTLHLTPVCADRPVVTRPVKPFAVPPGDQVTVYVSSPLWLQVEAGDTRRLLLEVPIFRPSDTWFGPSPREGELCYATRTSFRLNAADVPPRPHRATTRLRIKNPAENPLLLQRINLSVPHLPLYASASGALWTPDVTFERQDDFAPLSIAKHAPADADKAVEVSPARTRTTDNIVVRAFGSLFSD